MSKVLEEEEILTIMKLSGESDAKQALQRIRILRAKIDEKRELSGLVKELGEIAKNDFNTL